MSDTLRKDRNNNIFKESLKKKSCTSRYRCRCERCVGKKDTLDKIAEKELKTELKIMTTDKELLEWYYKGFDDELDGNLNITEDESLESRAYQIGANHAMFGDEVSSFDSLSKEQILKIIKGEKTTM